MKLGFVLPVEGAVASRAAVLDTARAAEASGADSVWTTDRILQPGAPPGGYPYSEDRGAIAFRTGRAWFEPIATMGLVAGVTERVRIGTNVLVVPYRHPVVLAQELATLDALSDGRILLGAGIGWMAEEFAALGVPRSERGPRTDEAIRLMRELWRSSDAVRFDGRFWRVDNMGLPAQPARPGGPPVLIGGNSDAALDRVVALGDGWLGADLDPVETAAVLERIAERRRATGRPASELELSTRIRVEPEGGDDALGGVDPGALRDRLAAYAAIGVDLLVIDVMNLPHAPTAVERIAGFAGA
ncbi:TIGR03619 family F420-dependent LLM class oxidoreductase [Protaetiibacter sp. SSC-01]|uniref:TIGR03619 family F420-dependent LLM class oxidoreductase n=1 Tax=Protaetiibacter sp. SSC-01 TaxID=2759943 RepID=UPI001656C5D8|nr:TIGR03619 family F420-dependent LLM class oxidoreductase [Protaetiibacter sp. SSC-01]QNO36883.1 TIGR03619 family F420-dependent LLM class oxidoreductase [Protaetiibacter sp. SSC-01]